MTLDTQLYIKELQAKIAQHEHAQALYKMFKSINPDLPVQTMETLVKAAYETGDISRSRAAEILMECVQDTQERGWIQAKYPERIEELESFISSIAACTSPGMAGWSAAARQLLERVERRYGRCDN